LGSGGTPDEPIFTAPSDPAHHAGGREGGLVAAILYLSGFIGISYFDAGWAKFLYLVALFFPCAMAGVLVFGFVNGLSRRKRERERKEYREAQEKEKERQLAEAKAKGAFERWEK
jgi:hypothetical protein